jgi:FkbM family methyltransferase
LTVNPDGRPLYVDANDTSVTPSILMRRLYEPGTTRLLCRLARTGHRILEVGANIGWHTLLAAERVGSTGRLVAIEPNPVPFDLLYLNVFVNGYADHCHLAQLALADAPGNATLHTAGSFLGSGRLEPFTAGELAWQRQPETVVDVEVSTLDELLGESLHFHVLKIDVEGAEPLVFAGGPQFFAENPALQMIMEFTPNRHGPELLDWLHEHRFCLYSISRLGIPERVSDQELLAGSARDIFACGKD